MKKEQVFQLSQQQKRIVSFGRVWSPSTFTSRLTARIEGVLDHEAVERELWALVRRQDLLRAEFVEGSESELWRVAKNVDGESSRARPGPNDSLPLFEAKIEKMAPGVVRLDLACAAAFSDARSLEILVEQLCASLGGTQVTQDGQGASQYLELCEWQTATRSSEEGQQEAKYWQSVDMAGLALGRLPCALPRARGSFAPQRLPLSLSKGTASAVTLAESAGNLQGGSLLLTCWLVLLARVCAREVVAIAAAVDGRVLEKVERAVGPFESSVPITFQWSPERTFSELVAETSALLAEAAERQEYFDPSTHDPGGPAGAPPPWLPFAFEWRARGQQEGAVRSHIEYEYGCNAPFEVRLVGHGTNEGLNLFLDFDSSVVGPADARCLGEALVGLIESAARGADVPAGALSWREAEGRALPALQGPKSSLPSSKVHEMIVEQAARTPSKIAVRAGTEATTYGALVERSAAVADALLSRGLGPRARVGLCLDRGVAILPHILGIWRAGAAYVPLEVDLPEERLSFMLADAGVSLVVTEEKHRSKFPGTMPLLVVGAEGDGRPALTDANASPDDVAYVMYTSGTTGEPNGVAVGHRSLANYLSWAVKEYDVRPDESSLVHSPLGFDLTVTTLFAPLLVGGTVVMLPEAAAVEALAEALWRDRYALVKLTPSHIEAMNGLAWSDGGKGRTKVLVVGGEELKADSLDTIRRRLPGVRIVNEYGPTEATVGCSAFTVPAGWRAKVPIGAAIANTHLYVLDSELRRVPLGATGELYVGGDCLALGYWKRPKVEAARFVRDPYGSPSSRMYRTGDLAFIGADGNLVYMGRADSQLKVRGVRIEPGEVETALKAHVGVSEAVVLTRETPGEGKSLVAFVTRDSRYRRSHTAGDLMSFLRSRLPGPLVPSHFYVVDRIPLTRNGKVDRAALLSLAKDPLGEGSPFVAPTTQVEKGLATIWAKVLKKDKVGIDDNYFALGGDSIRSIRVAGEAHNLGLSVSVADVHSFPTIRKLAAAIESSVTRAVQLATTSPFSLVPPEDRASMPVDVEDAYPLNLLQEGMIYHRSFSPKSAVYHAMISLHLKAPFDLQAMRLVIQRLVARHPLLRTSFELTRYTKPLQLVHKAAGEPLQFVDLSSLPSDRHKEKVLEWMEEEKKRGFDVDGYPLIRFVLHRLTNETFQLTFSYHHEIVDGWSEATMLTQVLDHYLSIVNGAEVEPPPPRAHFRDSVALEMKAVEDPAFREFWNRKMEGATLMRLPRLISGPKPDKGEREIVKVWVPFEAVIAKGARTLADQLAVPVKAILLSAHLRVMAMFGGHADVVTHTVAHGRPEDVDGADVIGLFVNSFTVRQTLPGASWRDLIQSTQKNEQESAAYRRYPMAELKRHQGREPLAETLFFLIDYHVYDKLKKWKNAELLDVAIYGESTFPFCATFRVPPLTNDLQMQIEYDSLQFSDKLIDSLIKSYKEVLLAMIRDVDANYFATDLLAPEEKESVLSRWNETERAPTGPACVHELFENQVATRPDSIAVASDNSHLTYGYLDAMADDVGRELDEAGAAVPSIVGVFMERSPEMLAAILGILKSGRGYLPMDPTQRSERLAHMAKEAGLSGIVAQPSLKDALRVSDAPILTVRTKPLPNLGRPQVRRGLAGPASIAYVIYTSGSTGNPKGVAVSHQNLVHSTMARTRHYGDVYSKFLLLSSFAFDSSIAGIFGTLCHGGTLVLPPGGAQLSIDLTVDAIENERITHLLCIPSLYTSLLEHSDGRQLESLRVAIMAGEACTRELWERHTARVPGARFYNEYGPTEATVWCTVWDGVPDGWRFQLPIGRPIDNTRLYITGPGQVPVPIGVQGKMFIGGLGVAQGYLSDPALTASRFVPDPYGSAGARLYDSGDVVRYRSDGQIEFLGRADNQVKVRGFRIEPQEIESVLDGHPMVGRSVIQAREDAGGEKVLVAYVVPKKGASLSAPEIQRYAVEKLPKYMRPSSVVILDNLPLTAAGKLDRKALPEPQRSSSDERRVPAPPVTPTEEVLAGIWSEVLLRENVGIHDTFFELGGESLRAMRIMAKVQKAFNVNLSAGILLETESTIATLGEAVEKARWAADNAAAFVKATGSDYEERRL
jgi:nonribosomal peptide synthetase protein BlmX